MTLYYGTWYQEGSRVITQWTGTSDDAKGSFGYIYNTYKDSAGDHGIGYQKVTLSIRQWIGLSWDTTMPMEYPCGNRFPSAPSFNGPGVPMTP